MSTSSITLILIGAIILVFILVASMIKIVPQRTAIIVERLGKFRAVYSAGFQVLIPFIDKVRYRHTLKEQAIDVASQICITRDNIAVEVDGILYLQVLDPQKASYGIDNYRFASIQIAQTTMRSVIGKLELDRTFEERACYTGFISMDPRLDPIRCFPRLQSLVQRIPLRGSAL